MKTIRILWCLFLAAAMAAGVAGCRKRTVFYSYYDRDKKIIREKIECVEKANREMIMDGEYQQWWRNGLPCFYAEFRNGKQNGETKEWYENGQLRSIYHYDNGMADGIYRWWDEKGKLLYEGRMVKGTGLERTFYPDGMLLRKLEWRDGKLHGQVVQYDRNGKVIKTVVYENGKVVKGP